MGQILVRQLDEAAIARLKLRARERNMSLEALAREVLHEAAAIGVAEKLALAKGPTVYILPRHGIEGWDREGEPMHAPEALAAFLDESRRRPIGAAKLIELDAHINDTAFAETALGVLDGWTREGLVPARRID